MAKELFRQNDNIVLENTIGNYLIFSNLYMQKKLLFKIKKQSFLVLDKFGRVRLSLESGHLINGHSQEISKNLSDLLTRLFYEFKSLSSNLFD